MEKSVLAGTDALLTDTLLLIVASREATVAAPLLHAARMFVPGQVMDDRRSASTTRLIDLAPPIVGGELSAAPLSAILSRRVFLRTSAVVGLATAAGCAGNKTNYPDPVEPGVRPGPSGPIATGPQFRPSPPVRSPDLPTPPPAPPQQQVVIPSGVIPRSNWTRVGIARPSEVYPLGAVSRITVHHEGVTPFTTTSEDVTRQRLEIIRRGHVSVRGWADIGYHYIIDPAGRVWEGRSIRYQGAHVKDQNENNLGIMCLGNFEKQSPTPAQQAALDRLLVSQMRQYRVGVARVYTHRELAPTECPGRSLQRYMVLARASGGTLRAALAEQGAADLATA